ncbi:MAG: metallophosphoesterase [Desulfobacterales bacterium]
MTLRFLHTSDWQIGMRAESAGPAALRLRAERLAAAERAIEAAGAHGCQMILIAGDVFEDNAVDRLLVRKVGDILGAAEAPIFIIPGNHDPLTPGSVWEHHVWREKKNITVVTGPEAIELDDCILYPCPLREKYASKNPTAWIDARRALKPAIGMAHGNVDGLPTEDPDYPIPRDTPARTGLDYLALGHWHSLSRFDDGEGACRMAYSGTHETTKFGERDSGEALVVDITGRSAVPNLTSITTGRLAWETIRQSVDQPGALKALADALDAVEAPEDTLMRIQLEGILFMEDRESLARVEEILSTRFLFGSLDAGSLTPAPDDDRWIDALPAGPFREAASRLKAMASQSATEGERAVATQALLHLFDLQEKSRP